MSNQTPINRILHTVNQAYSNGELQVHEDLPKGERGDPLADFLAAELREVTRGATTDEQAICWACGAVDSALGQLMAVRDALDNLAMDCAS